MSRFDRRRFLEDSMFAAAAAVTAGGVVPAFAEEKQSTSPNERLNVAIIGVNGRGGSHIGGFTSRKDTPITWLVDCDREVGQKRVDAVAKKQGFAPKFATDMREMLEDKEVDVVSIATPNHWHALAAIWAIQAGKDVYVEKPVSHNVSEGRRIVEAARKHNKICQTGTQCRSMPGSQEAIAYMKAGKIGQVKIARGLCYKTRNSIGPRGTYEVPASVDYNLWAGPAPMSPLTRPKFHYDWHWQWECGNGDLGNQGIHEVDIARWGLGVTHPTKVSSIGGKFMFDDDQETPNTQTCSYEFNVGGKTKMMTFEVRHWYSNHEAGIGGERAGNTIGNTFYGSQGYLVIDGYNKYYSFMGKEGKPGSARTDRDAHFGNFIDAVRTRKAGSLNAEIEEGALSCVLVHLANVSYRLGRTLHWDEKTWTVKGDPEANKMLTRAYRAPYIVPAKV